MRGPKHRTRGNGAGSQRGAGYPELASRVADLVGSIKPRALCDSCIALDLHVSYAEAHEAVLKELGEVFERTPMRCDRCSRVVDATRARAR
jgi:hypothetical protein